jgi:dipeptidyl aminopeptidase/acylaminoacyl peptidase
MAVTTARALVQAQVAIESFDLSADGEWVVYGSRTVRGGEDRSQLSVVPWVGGASRQLTGGAVRDRTPAVSPDGTQVAFVRGPVGEAKVAAQIWVAPLNGGDAWQLTHLPQGAGAPRWSPDGRQIAFLAAGGPDRFAIGERRGGSPTARRMIRTDYRDDEVGQLSRRTHLWVVRARHRARPRQLTAGDYDASNPAWAPDGSRLAFSADMGLDANIAPHRKIYAASIVDGDVHPLAALRGDADHASFSPDGRWVAFLGVDIADSGDYDPVRVWVVRASGGRARSLTTSLDRSVGCDAGADLVQAEDGQGPVWLSARELLVIVGMEGRNLPYRVTLTGEAEPMLARGRVLGAAIAAGNGRVALSAGMDRHAAEVYALDPIGSRGPTAPRRLSGDGSGWQSRFPLPRWDELWIDTPGGRMQVWVASPADAGDEPLPAILHLHGGPTGAWGPGGTLDATLLTAHGYRVVMPNIRGSNTFGAKWCQALRGRWGVIDARDATAAIDGTIARGLVDGDRLGVMGLSYGGYLAEWLIGATDRFKAAIGENGVSNQVATWSNSYFGVHFARQWKLGDPLSRSGMLRMWRSSPLSQVTQIHTPLLMLQSADDLVCPPADNEQLFIALKALGREVEYVLYPEEHHVMRNDGRPDRRTDRLERILAWFDRWLREPPA